MTVRKPRNTTLLLPPVARSTRLSAARVGRARDGHDAADDQEGEHQQEQSSDDQLGLRVHDRVNHAQSCEAGAQGVTRRCDVDQAPRGPLARRTHLTDHGIRSARLEHSARSWPLWGPRPGDGPPAEMAAALEAREEGPSRRVGPATVMAVITTRRGECQRDQAIGPASAAKDQRAGIIP